MSDVSTKPYLLRAIYEWCVDQGCTPYIAVAVDKNTRVPLGYAKDGQIVLNIGPMASNQLHMGNDVITFQARFNGQVQHLSVPVGNVAAIYARENGEGMGFEVELLPDAGGEPVVGIRPEPVATESAPDDRPEPPKPETPRPRLTRIK